MPNPIVEVVNGALTVAHATDAGKTGKNNEDNYAVFESKQRVSADEDGLVPTQVAVVADGIGGSVNGEVASQLAIDTFVAHFKHEVDLNVHERLEVAVYYANRALFDAGRENPELKGMGTTIVAAMVVDDYLYLAHAGDSRAYLVRNGQILLLTLDHSWVQEAIDANFLTLEEAKHHPNRNVIKRFLGPLERVEVDHKILEVENRTENMQLPQYRRLAQDDRLALLPGDIILLCSDGLNDAIPDSEILRILLRYRLQNAARELIRSANAAGGPDNITVLILEKPGVVMLPAEPLESGDTTQLWMPSAAASEDKTVRLVDKSRTQMPVRIGLVAGLLLLIVAATLLWAGGLLARLTTPPNGTPSNATISDVGLTPEGPSATPTEDALSASSTVVEERSTAAPVIAGTTEPQDQTPIPSAAEETTSTLVFSVSQPGISVEQVPSTETTSDTSTVAAPVLPSGDGAIAISSTNPISGNQSITNNRPPFETLVATATSGITDTTGQISNETSDESDESDEEVKATATVTHVTQTSTPRPTATKTAWLILPPVTATPSATTDYTATFAAMLATETATPTETVTATETLTATEPTAP